MAGTVTVTDVESSMTWLLVSTSPLGLITMPVPAACSLLYRRAVLMITTPGRTRAAMSCALLPIGAAEDGGAGTMPLPWAEPPEPPDAGL